MGESSSAKSLPKVAGKISSAGGSLMVMLMLKVCSDDALSCLTRKTVSLMSLVSSGSMNWCDENSNPIEIAKKKYVYREKEFSNG